MFLEKLLVKTDDTLIREVVFRRGLNLVVDNPSLNKTESGNNVGKSTLLKVIDYCFGSDGKRIYEDYEFKTINETVYKFLTEKNVVCELHLEMNGERHSLKRDFKGLFEIDGEPYTTADNYCKKVKEICFNSSLPKPTLRQLMNKFDRIEDYQVTNTLKCAHPSTEDSVYEMMYLFLFGFENQELLMALHTLKSEIKALKEKKNALLKTDSLGSLRQAVGVIKKEIEEAEDRKKNFEIENISDDELKQLAEIKQQISTLSVEVSNLEMRLGLNMRSIEELKKDSSKINLKTIDRIYEEAKVYLPSVSKTLEEARDFYNQMIHKRVEFIDKEISKLQPIIKEKRALLKAQISQEKKLFSSMSDKGNFSDLQKLHDELYKLYEKKGQRESLISIIEETNGIIKSKTSELNILEEKMGIYQEDLQNKIRIFNEYFSDYSKKLYGQNYFLSYDKDDTDDTKNNKFGFKIDNVEKNVGTGKKKGEMTAFDLAYISFLNRLGSKGLRFVLHDKQEPMHINQIKTSFDIANGIDGQYVVSILRDRISELGNDFIETNAILKLSQSDKFFKIEMLGQN